MKILNFGLLSIAYVIFYYQALYAMDEERGAEMHHTVRPSMDLRTRIILDDDDVPSSTVVPDLLIPPPSMIIPSQPATRTIISDDDDDTGSPAIDLPRAEPITPDLAMLWPTDLPPRPSATDTDTATSASVRTMDNVHHCLRMHFINCTDALNAARQRVQTIGALLPLLRGGAIPDTAGLAQAARAANIQYIATLHRTAEWEREIDAVHIKFDRTVNNLVNIGEDGHKIDFLVLITIVWKDYAKALKRCGDAQHAITQRLYFTSAAAAKAIALTYGQLAVRADDDSPPDAAGGV
jgi:hypothetical protein